MKKENIERIAIYVSDKKDGTDGMNFRKYDYDHNALDFAIDLVDFQKTFKFVKIVIIEENEEDLEAYMEL